MVNRIDQFSRYWVHQLRTYDCDPGIYVLKYIIQRMELNEEQKYWLCWLYANTYQIATTWVLFNEFPDYQSVDIDRLRNWNEANKSRLPYQKDQKWLRGNLAPMFLSYKESVGYSQVDFFKKFDGDFEGLWDHMLKKFYKFGRFTGWMYFQALSEICGIDLNPDGLQLHHPSSWAHRAGLCRVAHKDDWAEKGYRFTKEQIAWLEDFGKDIQAEISGRYPELTVIKPDFYSMETSLCAFSKLFRKTRGRYLGYYLDRMAQDIHKTMEKDWAGINWDLLWEARNEILIPELCDNSGEIKKDLYGLFLEKGLIYPQGKLLDKLDSLYKERRNV